MDRYRLVVRIRRITKRGALVILALIFLGGVAAFGLPGAAAGTPGAPDREALRTRALYLPQMLDVYPPKPPVMLGIYPTDYWQPTIPERLEIEFRSLEGWSGERLSLAGVFHFFEQPNSVSNLLGPIWDAGYTPFVNIYTDATAAQVANGKIDSLIHSWARGFAVFANGGKRFAFLAPLQEMNGYWVPYKLDPANFIIAFKRIQNIFAQEGVPDVSVAWVFAPNGSSRIQDPPFEDYYPGDEFVDAVGFSSYNFGYHPKMDAPVWLTPRRTFRHYIERMKILAPAKPLFIAQTATTAYTESGFNPAAKDEWLRTAYPYLASMGVRGVLYYNHNIDFDWAFYEKGRTAYQGYRDGVTDPAYKYVAPDEIQEAFR